MIKKGNLSEKKLEFFDRRHNDGNSSFIIGTELQIEDVFKKRGRNNKKIKKKE